MVTMFFGFYLVAPPILGSFLTWTHTNRRAKESSPKALNQEKGYPNVRNY